MTLAGGGSHLAMKGAIWDGEKKGKLRVKMRNCRLTCPKTPTGCWNDWVLPRSLPESWLAAEVHLHSCGDPITWRLSNLWPPNLRCLGKGGVFVFHL